jgi:hypothetical protein
MKNKVLRTIGNFPRCTPVRVLHTAFDFLYAYDCIRKLCRQQAEVIQNHEDEHIRSIGQGEARHRRYKSLKLYDRKGSVAKKKKKKTNNNNSGREAQGAWRQYELIGGKQQVIK